MTEQVTHTGEVPVVTSSRASRRVAIAHLVVTLAGVAILAWMAHPTYGSMTESLPDAGFWRLLVGSAVALGGIGGVLEGLALRFGQSLLAIVVLVVAAMPGLWLPALALGRWFSEQQGDLIEAGALTGGLAGWLLLMITMFSVSALVSSAGRRSGSSS